MKYIYNIKEQLGRNKDLNCGDINQGKLHLI